MNIAEPSSSQFLAAHHEAALRECEAAGWNPARLRRPTAEEQARLMELQLSVSSPSSAVTMAGVTGAYAAVLSAMLGRSWSRVIASHFDSSSPSETYPWLRAAPNPRKWEGERTAQELANDVVTIVNDDYESTIEFRIPDLRRDKTGQVMQRVSDLATRVAFFPEKLISDLLIANGNAYDGVAFFATTHSVGSSGTINNAIVAADGLAGGANPTSAQQAANIGLLLSRQLGFLDDKAQPLHEAARQFAVMVPPGMFGATVAAINSAFTSAAASNPLRALTDVGYTFVPLMNGRLTATNQIYLFRLDGGVKAFLLQEEGVNPMALGPESEHAKKTNRAMFGHGWNGGVGYGRFEFGIRGTTS